MARKRSEEYKEKQREYNRRYRESHRVERREYDRAINQTPERREAQKKAREEWKKTPQYKEKLARDKVAARHRREAYRKKVIELLGGKCIRCGFSDWRALQIDHINGGGNQHRKNIVSFTTYYKEILAIGPEKFQLLCANCNQIKRYEEGEGRKN